MTWNKIRFRTMSFTQKLPLGSFGFTVKSQIGSAAKPQPNGNLHRGEEHAEILLFKLLFCVSAVRFQYFGTETHVRATL